MKIFTTHVDYKVSNYKPVVRIIGRGDDGKRVIKHVMGFEPHGFTKEQEIVGVNDARIVRYENSPPSLYGDKTVKFVCNIPADVSGKDEGVFYVKDNFKSLYETDVLFATRCKIDGKINGVIEVPERTFISKNDLKPSKAKIPLRTQFIDIESIPSGTIKDVIDGKVEIPCFTVFDTYLNKYILFTTISLSQKDKETIKEKIHSFWVTSLENLKTQLSGEKDEEKHKILEKQVKYLERNLTRILNSINIDIITSPDEISNFNSYLYFLHENRPDIQAGWNSVDFDSPVILNRLKTLKLPFQQLSDVGNAFVSKSGECNIEGLVLLDLMERYVGMQQATPSHKSLDYICKKELGIGKLIVGGHSLYTSDPLTFLAYNIVDVMLCVELDNLLHIIDFYVEVAILTNSNLSDMTRAQYIDNLILSFCNGMYVLPTRSTITSERMSGAVVYTPSPGLHKYVILLDFKGMYPSIMKTLNISPETKSPDGDIIAANGVRFSSKKIGIIPYILLTLESKREEYKKLMKEAEKAGDTFLSHEYDLKQSAVKIISNAFYGILGYKKFRLADRDVGDAVTSTGRSLSVAVKDYVESLDYKTEVIYGDSVTKDTIIWIKTKDGNIFEEKIENLFKKVDCRDGEKEYDLLEDLQTLTIDKEGKSVWRPIKYVMRHKTDKQIIKISSGEYNVSVTEDHSLMTYKEKKIEPIKTCDIFNEGLMIIKHIPRENINSKNYPKELYHFMGLFIGDGSFDVKCGEIGRSIHLSCGFDVKEIIEKVLKPLQNMGYIRTIWERKKGDVGFNGNIIKIMEEFRDINGKIIPKWLFEENEENLSYFLSGIYESDGYISKRTGSDNYVIAFCNCKENIIHDIKILLNFIGIPTSITKSEHNKSGYCVMGYRSNYKWDFKLHIRNNFVFKEKIKYITNKKQEKLNKIKFISSHIDFNNRKMNLINAGFDIINRIKKEDIKYSDYVYDVEVEDNHTFFANGFLAHNTDSLFIELKEKDVTYKRIKDVADELTNKINNYLPKLVKERFNADKCYCKIEADEPVHTMCMLPKKTVSDNETEQQAKKRYAKYIWKGEGKYEFKVKGLEYVKGNTAEITRYVQEKLLKYVLDSTDDKIISSFLRDLHTKFFNNELSIEYIGKPGYLRKNLLEYSSDLNIKRACEYSNHKLGKEFTKDSSFVLYYIKNGDTDVLALNYAEPLPPEYKIDMKTTWEKLVESPTETILQARKLNWIEIISALHPSEFNYDNLLSGELPITIPQPQPKKDYMNILL